MSTPNTGIGAITLRTMRTKLEEAAAVARAVEGCAVDGQAAGRRGQSAAEGAGDPEPGGARGAG